jgi:hypothetical protein
MNFFSKNTFGLLFTIVLLAIVLVGCQTEKPYRTKRHIKLEIVTNTNLFHRLNEPIVCNSGNIKSWCDHDTIKNITIWKFDSLLNESTQIRIFSLLTPDFNKTIDLQKDTQIIFDSTEYTSLKQGNIAELSTMPISDTLYFSLVISGCFMLDFQKVTVQKSVKENSVLIHYQETRNPQKDTLIKMSNLLFIQQYSSFILKSSQKPKLDESIKLKGKKGKNILLISSPCTASMNHYYPFIRNRNTIYDLYGNNPCSYEFYNDFIKSLGIKTE